MGQQYSIAVRKCQPYSDVKYCQPEQADILDHFHSLIINRPQRVGFAGPRTGLVVSAIVRRRVAARPLLHFLRESGYRPSSYCSSKI
jgi:hypothetical protein